MRILVTGSNGLLGQKLIYALRQTDDVNLTAVARGDNRINEKSGYDYVSADLTDEKTITDVVAACKPDCIIHTAAMTNVDACELNPDDCAKNNIDAVRYLIQAAKKTNAHFIYISTDFVFDGTAGPYKETDEPKPLSIYGYSKLNAEKLVAASGLPWTIIRTMIIYGVTDDAQRSNVVLWTKQSLEAGKKITVITDQFRGPTLAEDLADACIKAALNKVQGIFHVSGREVMPIIDVSYAVADHFRLDRSLIVPITTAELKQPAARPLKTGFIIDKAVKELSFHPRSLKDGIAVIAQQLLTKNRQ